MARCRMGKDASPAKAAPAQPVRFLEKHNYTQPSAKQLLEGERPAPGTAVPLALGPRWLAYASNQARADCCCVLC